jgi:hypothetical protein
MTGPRRAWLYSFIAVGAGLCLLLIALGLLGKLGDSSSCDFDGQEWLEATQGKFGDYDKAKPIADELIHCDDPLYGRSRAEVQALLGERDFGGRRNPKANIWGYDIGVPGALSDYPGLQVHFDEKGRVDEVSIPDYEER